LQIAASLGDPDIVRLLVESGADVDQSADEGYTALVEAVIEDNLPVAAYLIEAGANVNQVAAGQTPVMIAADAGKPRISPTVTRKWRRP
jgi:ankyrin repeat protein